MKFTITRINKQNKLMVSSKTVERFLERIAKDDAKLSVTNFRMSVPLMEADYQYYKGIKEWQHVYPAAEFNKDESGNLVFQKSNGLVMLHFINLMSEQEKHFRTIIILHHNYCSPFCLLFLFAILPKALIESR